MSTSSATSWKNTSSTSRSCSASARARSPGSAALQNHLAVGYKLIVIRVVSQPDRERHQLLSIALQRAIHCLGALLIRSTQLYGPAAPAMAELHQLYQLAVEQGTERLLIRDPLARHAKGLSAEQSYLASLLLGCARCNQMRQQSIVKLAAALEAWSGMAQIQAVGAAGSLFLFSCWSMDHRATARCFSSESSRTCSVSAPSHWWKSSRSIFVWRRTTAS